MDSTTIFSKTAKGMKEANGTTSVLPRTVRSVLKEIDGKKTYADLVQLFSKYPEADLQEMFEDLVREGYLRNILLHQSRAATEPPVTPPAPVAGANEEAIEDLDFTAIASASPAAVPPAPRGEELKARQEAEARAKREAEERARKEAEAKAKHEAAERARQEAAAKAQREAEERARKAAEEKARHEAEEKARREAEAKAKREAEEKARQEAEEQVRREAAAQAQREEEERMRREAEERARQEAQAKAQREAEERARREAEERARQEAEEKARREAEEKARRDEEARLRKEAEEAERRAARERAEQEARDKARLKAELKAAKKAERAANVSQIRWGKLTAMAAPLLLAVVLAAVHLIPFSGRIPGMERRAGERFGQTVKIEGLHFALFPQPQWKLEGVTVGSAGEFRAPRVNAILDLGALFTGTQTIKSLDIESPSVQENAAASLLFGKGQGQALKISRLRMSNASLESPSIKLPRLDVNAEFGDDGEWRKVIVESAARDIFVTLTPGGARAQFELSASTFTPPFGGTLPLNSFTAKGSIGRKEMAVDEFEGRNFDGTFVGRARLRWSGGWSLEGTVEARRLDAAKLAPALFAGGNVDGQASYTAQAAQADGLVPALRVDGNFKASQGAVLGIDLMHMLASATADSGKTSFRELAASFARDGGGSQLRQLRFDAGVLSANGSVEIGSDDTVRGRFTAAYRFDNQVRSSPVSLTGKLQAPKFGR